MGGRRKNRDRRLSQGGRGINLRVTMLLHTRPRQPISSMWEIWGAMNPREMIKFVFVPRSRQLLHQLTFSTIELNIYLGSFLQDAFLSSIPQDSQDLSLSEKFFKVFDKTQFFILFCFFLFVLLFLLCSFFHTKLKCSIFFNSRMYQQLKSLALVSTL